LKNSIAFIFLTLSISLISCTEEAKKHKKADSKITKSSNTTTDPASIDIDNFNYSEPPKNKEDIKAKIDSLAESLVEKDISLKHYSIKKMNSVFELIPKMFNYQFMIDFW
jgi:hypothetical protein